MAEHKKYSINEASLEELAQIPGVDDKMAETIVEFRERRGRIHNLEELADIEQIEPEEMDQLREWLTVASEKTGYMDFEGQKEEPDIV
jgi:competence protein ComEA